MNKIIKITPKISPTKYPINSSKKIDKSFLKIKKYLTRFVKKPLINVEITVKKNKYFKLNLLSIFLKNLFRDNAFDNT